MVSLLTGLRKRMALASAAVYLLRETQRSKRYTNAFTTHHCNQRMVHIASVARNHSTSQRHDRRSITAACPLRVLPV